MKILFFFLMLLASSSGWSACSSAYEKVYINEVNTKTSQIELFTVPGALNGDYVVTACTSNKKEGKVCESHTYTLNGTTQWYLNTFSNISNQDDLDVTLYGPDGKVADYVLIGAFGRLPYNTDYLLCPSIVLNYYASHRFIRSNAGQRDFYRSPDGGDEWKEEQWQDNTLGGSNTGDIPPPPECTAFAYDLYHTADPYRLQTRLASHPFDVNVTVACTGTGAIPSRKITNIYGFTGTCPASTAGLPIIWSGAADINETQKTITLSGLNSPRAYADIGLMLETDHGELHCSSDRLAIRPSSFAISSPASQIRAGEITLQVSATQSGGGYDGTATATTALQTPDPDCPISSGFLSAGAVSEPLSLPFSGDVHTSEMNATDIGEIILSVRDTSWTAVDQGGDCIIDSNATMPDAQGRFGCNIDSNLSLRIVPHHFDVNATLSNAGNGFTYLSNDLTMSATLDLRLSAQTEQNATTRNYNAQCHAQTTNHAVNYAINPAVSVGDLHYLETNTSRTDINTTATSFVLANIPKDIFGSDTNGSARLEIRLNFERNAGVPVDPFDLNISSISVTDADGVTGSDVAAGDATFVYGRIQAYDITTDMTDVPNPVEIEIYGKNSSHDVLDGKFQNTLYWYRNINHDIEAVGAGTAQNNAIEVNATRESPSGGLHTIWITNDDQITGKQKITLELPEWLSIIPANNMFNYQYIKPAIQTDELSDTARGVNSGDFTGSDFEIQHNKNTTKKGIKVFR